MRIVCEACEIAFMVIEHFLLLFLYIYNYIFFSRPLSIFLHYFSVLALYPEPSTRSYEIRIYLHRSALRAVQAYNTPNSCGECLLVNPFGVRPFPTGYSLYALNPLLQGLEPGPAQSTLTELHCWC